LFHIGGRGEKEEEAKGEPSYDYGCVYMNGFVDVQRDVTAQLGQHGVGMGMRETETAHSSR